MAAGLTAGHARTIPKHNKRAAILYFPESELPILHLVVAKKGAHLLAQEKLS